MNHDVYFIFNNSVCFHCFTDSGSLLFPKIYKIRNRLPDIDGEEELMKPYNLLMQELEQKQQQLKQQSLQHHLLVKAIKLKLWKWDLKRKEIIWEGNLEKGDREL